MIKTFPLLFRPCSKDWDGYLQDHVEKGDKLLAIVNNGCNTDDTRMYYSVWLINTANEAGYTGQRVQEEIDAATRSFQRH